MSNKQHFIVMALITTMSEDHVTVLTQLIDEAVKAQLNCSWQKSELHISGLSVYEVKHDPFDSVPAIEVDYAAVERKVLKELEAQSTEMSACAFCHGDFLREEMSQDIRDLDVCSQCVLRTQRAYRIISQVAEELGGEANAVPNSTIRIMANLFVTKWVKDKPDLTAEQFIRYQFLSYNAKTIWTNLNIWVAQAQRDGEYNL